MRDPDAGNAKHRAEVKREPGVARMITPRRVDENHIRLPRKVPDRGLEQRSLAECE